ncbi:MAG: hypothetical protein IJL19_11085 [Clostridiales bacterium]|nr:hypothetical protein [Clostridiales bacterium]
MKLIRAASKLLTAAAALCAVLLFFGFRVDAEFKHPEIEAIVPFTCAKVESNTANDYEIVIEKIDEASPVPGTLTQTVNGSGDGFFTITIDEPGTYQYRIYEKAGTNSKIIYDDTSYTVTLFVTSDDAGNLDYQVILSKGGMIKPTEVAFANRAVKTMVSTGESASSYLLYALAAFATGGAILILALRRRKEDADV